jgi:hypothetical protein
MKNLVAILSLICMLLLSCAPAVKTITPNLSVIIDKPSYEWTLEECEKIISFYKSQNYSKTWDDQIITSDDAIIEAVPLNKIVIQAVARKEGLNKRLSEKEYFQKLETMLENYTDYKFDPENKEIIKTEDNLENGLAFQITFQNNTNPYKPIILEDGYDYFFLENLNGMFSRVIEVSGIFADQVFQLDGFLPVTVTFSKITDEGTNIFENNEIESIYKLVFNGLQTRPIELLWQVKNNK